MQWFQGKLLQAQSLVQAAAVLMAIIAILGAWFRTKALVPTVTAAILSGFVLWGINNTSWFQTKVGEESGLGVPAPAAPSPVVVVLGGPPGPGGA
jgi:hypothetical protein